MRIAIVGAGYVGLVTGACLAEHGHDVLIIDHDENKLSQINSGISPIHEPGLDKLLQTNLNTRLQATADLAGAVQSSDVTLIAVGTPYKGDAIDLSQVRAAAIEIGKALQGVNSYHVVAVKSTVVPGTTDDLVKSLIQQHSSKHIGKDIGIGMNPEFLREGSAVFDFTHPDRIVLGGVDQRTRDTLAELYQVFGDTDIVHVNNRTAETIKYASNALLATLISYSNEIGNLCAQIDNVDVVDVLHGVHLDKRFSPLLDDGQRIRPELISYIAAGCGFGGSCFPKDVNALRAFGRQHGVAMPVLDAVMQTNELQPNQVWQQLTAHYPDVQNTRIAVLGLAFKPGTDDVRESPALPIVQRLLDAGADVSVYDPVAMETAKVALGEHQPDYAQSVRQAIEGAQSVLIMTSWPEFAALPELLAACTPQPLVVDGRRMLDPQSVEHYVGIGRGRQTAQTDATDHPSKPLPKDSGSVSAA